VSIECRRCVLSSAVDSRLQFDDTGLCSHCQHYDKSVKFRVESSLNSQSQLKRLLDRIKNSGARGEYDCIIGVSGGVDSAYVLHLACSYGLRPLAVHFDNGWNSELAVNNLQSVLGVLNIDLVTIVADWDEFRDLQLSFLKASTPDGEIPTDHAIFACLWREAYARKIKFVITGMNFSTEAYSNPDWAYGHSDWRYIRYIQRMYGTMNLRSYPYFSVTDLLRNSISGIRMVSLLNYISYDKNDALLTLKKSYGWNDYGQKHHESIYTRFWQGYVLPRKFNIDKRYAHYSDLINSGQLSKAEAHRMLEQNFYLSEKAEDDRQYVVKKLRLSDEEFERLMSNRPRNFKEYPNNFYLIKAIKFVLNLLRSLSIYPR